MIESDYDGLDAVWRCWRCWMDEDGRADLVPPCSFQLSPTLCARLWDPEEWTR